ncbi:MAG: hypothetical protein V3U35_01180 [Candidatus Neomarinimicrobiota bacterium]
MSLRSVALTTSLLMVLGSLSLTRSQEPGQLSQKLLLESTVQQRITNAISKILDESQFVVDVKVELAFTTARQVEMAYRGPDGRLIRPGQVPGDDGSSPGEAGGAPSRTVTNPFPIPGFPDVTTEERGDAVRALDELTPADGAAEALDESMEGASEAPVAEMMTEAGGMPTIESMAISIILEDGVSPQIIENVRQVTLVASRFDRDRGDILSITTAAFKDRRQASSELASPSSELMQAGREQSEVMQETLREAQARNEALLQELRDRELEYLERSEEERKQALADLAQVQNERAKDLIFLQQQREEQNTRLQEALLTQIDEMRKDLTSGRLTPGEGDIVSVQVTSLEDSLKAMRLAFGAERERYEAQIDDLLQPVEPPSTGLLADGQGLLVLLGVALLVVMAIVAVALLTSRSRAQMAPAGMMYPPPARPYPRRRPPRPAPPKTRRKAKPEKAEEADAGEEIEPEKAAKPAPAPEPAKAAAVEEVAEEAAEVAAAEAETSESEDAEAPPSHAEESPEVLQSEVSSLRQSVVSMSVGKPETATRIVGNWLQQGAPADEVETAEGEAPEVDESVEQEDS